MVGRPVVALASSFHPNVVARGIIHASQKRAANAFPKWSELGLTYPITVEMKPNMVILNTMWSAPPSHGKADFVPDGLPFAVSRTEEGKSLPVYLDYKGGGTKVTTQIRRIRGDVFAMQSDMSKVCDGNTVLIRPGKLVVDGNYHGRLKMWLAGLGF